jgi:hypothetical protein
MKRISLLLAFLFINIIAFGQAAGYIEGKVTDADGKPLQNISVTVFNTGGQQMGSDKTNQFGKYNIKPLQGGSYDVVFSSVGYAEDKQKGIYVENGSGATVNAKMYDKKNVLITVNIRDKKPKVFIDKTKPGTPPAQTGASIAKMATANVLDAAANRPGVYQAKSGSGISLGGGRTGNTLYLVDGQLIRSANFNINAANLEALSVNIGGLAASLGDATGGVISLTTKGMSTKPTGTFNFQHSIEGYNANQFNTTFRGPLYKKKEVGGAKRPVLGYALGFGGAYDLDGDPSYDKYYVPTADALAKIKAEPLTAISTAGGNTVFINSAQYLTMKDFTTQKARQNGAGKNLNGTFKLVYKPTTNIDVTLGGNGYYSTSRGSGPGTGAGGANTFGNNMFNSYNNVENNNLTGRGFLRFQQKLSKVGNNAEGIKPLISNAYYIVQLSYEKSQSVSQNPMHKSNFFRYGYVGKFTPYQTAMYGYDTTRGGFKGIKFAGFRPDSMTFQADERYNPDLAAYTKYVYGHASTLPVNITSLAPLGGLANGDNPQQVFGLFQNYGNYVSVFRRSQLDQFSLNFDASFDINVNEKKSQKLNRDLAAKHAIEFGMYFEQRNSKSYAVSGRGLWSLMRQLANQNIQNFDFKNPYWTKNGVKYTAADVANGVVTVSDLDTIRFNRLVDDSTASAFGSNFRKSLGLDPNGTEYLNIDGYDPAQFNMNMFSADDLTSQGQQLVAYYGYDHTGKQLSARPSFEDFWKQKDAKTGQFTRAIAPFTPIYVAGYIQDNFAFRDIRFRLGVRVDRYDANQKVLRDPYSLFATRKVSDLKANQFTRVRDAKNGNILAPDPTSADFKSQFGDAVVYIDDNGASNGAPKIVGYRNGDTWYDPFGKEISDPSVLKEQYTGGTSPQPYLQNGKDLKTLQSASYDVNAAFTDYKPRINVSPRISFSFPVDGDKSLFYAHYDVVTQRPSAGESFITPDDYFYMNDRAGQGTLANPNLNPEKLIDYELGFQQQINKSSAVTISGTYKERRDQIQLQNIISAYPLQYQTFGNRDFSTVKAFTLLYDLRPVKGNLNANIAYTLQFAEGTGSGSTSQRSLLASGQPNLRTVLPLDYDSRHSITANIDYRYSYADGDNGPQIGKHHPFAGMGINIVFQARSGEPFTKLTRAVPLVGGDFNSNIISGTVNGSRRPWSNNTNLRIDKDLIFNRMSKADADGKRAVKKTYGLNIYAYTQNLFNKRNVIAVHPYTGLATDDGYINSAQGQQTVGNVPLAQRQSFIDYYGMALRNPAYFSNPRRLYVGFTFNF